MKKFGLIGYPLGHSVSPFVHTLFYEISGLDAEYRLYPVQDVSDFPRDLDGFSVTIPHKLDIIPYLNAGIDYAAKEYGAVNTVAKTSNGYYGYNTDVYGFTESLRYAGGSLAGSVLLLGSGGAGRVAAFETIKNGGRLTVAIRDTDSGRARADALISELHALAAGAAPRAGAAPGGNANVSLVYLSDLESAAETYDVMVNATPCGMYPNTDVMPVSAEFVRSGRVGLVYDMIYNPAPTLLVSTAVEAGIPAADGVMMLVLQAALANKYWNGLEFTESQTYAVYDKTVAELRRKFAR